MATITRGKKASATSEQVTLGDRRRIDRQTSRQSLETSLLQRIRRLTGTRIQQLSVEALPKEIHIRGRCWTFYTKQLAQQAVMALREGETIVNEIEVAAP